MTADTGVLTVEPMTIDHLRRVHEIDCEVYPEPWSLTLWKQELARPRDRVYQVCRSGDEVVGHMGMLLVLDEGHVSTVAVDPRWQGRGVATLLLLATLPEAIGRGVRSLTLEVRVSNQRAQRLYQRFGFAPAGVRKNYYADSNEDAIIMWASEVDDPGYTARLARIAAPGDDRRDEVDGAMNERRVDGRVLGVETSCDETAVGAGRPRGRRVVERGEQSGRPPRPIRRRRT